VEQKQSDRKRWVAGAVVVAAVIAIVLTGSLAYINNQHKTNALMDGQNAIVTLNDSFKPPTLWAPGGTVNDYVSATNPATNDDPVFVRIQFREYLEFVPRTLVIDKQTGYPLLFATYASGDKIGEYILWDDKPASYNYIECNVGGTDGVGGVNYCLTQNTELKDGIYGKPMYDKGVLNVFGDAPKEDSTGEPQSGEDPSDTVCNYDVTQWNGTTRLAGIRDQGGHGTADISEYISWTLGPNVISMDEWAAGGYETGDFWIIDDTDGWFYWANPLAPGKSTTNALDSVTLTALQNSFTNLEYYIHTDVQSCTGDEFANGEWADASTNAKKLIDIFLGAVIVKSTTDMFDNSSDLNLKLDNSSDLNLKLDPEAAYAGLYEVLAKAAPTSALNNTWSIPTDLSTLENR